jgi:hypothetical protein
MCSSQQPAVVQNFHYELPAAYQQYKSAVYYRTDFDGDPVPPYSARSATIRAFGATALGDAREVVYNNCETDKGRVSMQAGPRCWRWKTAHVQPMPWQAI